MNPFNPEAGDTPAPAAPEDLAVVEHSARVMWRAFPYFGWRYGERGRAFGRSDAGFLVTLTRTEDEAAWQQVLWLARVLAARGMPTLLLEYQLESLGRTAQRAQRASEARLLALAAQLRSRRLSVLDASLVSKCEQLCWGAARAQRRRRGAGLLIAAAVADRALGMGPHDEALVRWFSQAEPGERAWSEACTAARALALAHTSPEGGAGR